ncbi:MAG: ABC transporter ATP-binding protein [candidate division WOR-3 bacterium]
MGTILSIQNVTKRFGGYVALLNVTMEVREKEIVGLIGPNGAGKSTLFNVITSITPPDEGDVFLMGKKVTNLPPHKLCEMGIARTFQTAKTISRLTALENVLIPLLFARKITFKKAVAEGIEALNLVGLEEKAHMRVQEMTLADRRLLEVARVIAANPKVALLDEPMAGLNSGESNRLGAIIEKVRSSRGTAVLWIEHKIKDILKLCDRIVVLNFGAKIADGLPKEVTKNEQVIAAYLGTKHVEGC